MAAYRAKWDSSSSVPKCKACVGHVAAHIGCSPVPTCPGTYRITAFWRLAELRDAERACLLKQVMAPDALAAVHYHDTIFLPFAYRILRQASHTAAQHNAYRKR